MDRRGRVLLCWKRQGKKAKRADAAAPRESRRTARPAGDSNPCRYWLIFTAKVNVAVPLGATELLALPQLTAVAVCA